MDVLCPRCGEPWDMDSIHEEVAERDNGDNFQTVWAEFRTDGCHALRNFTGESKWCERNATPAAVTASALYDMLGDDVDGAAAMLEDFGV